VNASPTLFGLRVPSRLPRRLLAGRRLLIGAPALLLVSAAALLASRDTQLIGAMRAATSRTAAAAAVNSRDVVLAADTRGRRTPSATPVRSAASSRVADAPLAAALFSPHTWHVDPPPPPPLPPPPPAVPTAPPFPYTFVGAMTNGDKTVYFLSRADRVIDVHVGDQLDGIYDFESADAGQLIFNYLPLNIRQSLSSGASP
jgi:hypothetical protein